MSSDPEVPFGFNFAARVHLKGAKPTVLLYNLDRLADLLSSDEVRYLVAKSHLHRVRVEVLDTEKGTVYHVYYEYVGEFFPRSRNDVFVVHDFRRFDQVEDVISYLYTVFERHRDKPVRFELTKVKAEG